MRYIELNPVRANMVPRPEEYQHFGTTTEERCYAYQERFKHQLNEQDLHLIREAAHYCQPNNSMGSNWDK